MKNKLTIIEGYLKKMPDLRDQVLQAFKIENIEDIPKDKIDATLERFSEIYRVRNSTVFDHINLLEKLIRIQKTAFDSCDLLENMSDVNEKINYGLDSLETLTDELLFIIDDMCLEIKPYLDYVNIDETTAAIIKNRLKSIEEDK